MENLVKIIGDLKNEKSSLEASNKKLSRLLKDKKMLYVNMRNEHIESLLPDLSISTIINLRQEISGFVVPVKRSFWTLWLVESVDSSISLNEYRNKLSHHLDKYDLWPANFENLDFSSDEKIFSKNSEKIASLSLKIEALENLLDIKIEKLSPKMQLRLNSVSKYFESKTPFTTIVSKDDIRRKQTYSDNDMDLLEMWFWYQLLSDTSELAEETRSSSYINNEPLVSGGNFDGGGADVSMSEYTNDSSHLSAAVAIGTGLGIAAAVVTEEVLPESTVLRNIASDPDFALDRNNSTKSDTVVSNCDCRSDCSRDCSSNCDCRSDCSRDCSSNCDCRSDCSSNCDCSGGSD